MKSEKILCAAIWFNDCNPNYPHQPKNIETGFVVTGRRHHNCFATLSLLMGVAQDKYKADRKVMLHALIPHEQGFITNLDRFVSREEGLQIAIAANQTIDTKEVRGNKLFSEDLY